MMFDDTLNQEQKEEFKQYLIKNYNVKNNCIITVWLDESFPESVRILFEHLIGSAEPHVDQIRLYVWWISHEKEIALC